MSVESQTAGKLESTSTDVDYADEIERDINPDDQYEFLKDDVGSSVSTTSNHPSDLCLNKSKLDMDCCSSTQVC